MFKRFSWTPQSHGRNNLTLQYEPIQPYIFIACIEMLKCEYVFDIGANVGQYSIFASSIQGVEKVYSFEAEQNAFEEMSENIALNCKNNQVDARFNAVSDSNGKLEFGVVGAMAGNNAVVETSIHNTNLFRERRFVTAVTLDSEFDFAGKNLGFKIDVEGHEESVIQGAKRLLSDNISVLQIEIYDEQTSVIDILKKIGYNKIFRAGPDYYFTNHYSMAEASNMRLLLESAVDKLIDYNLKG